MIVIIYIAALEAALLIRRGNDKKRAVHSCEISAFPISFVLQN